MTIVNNGGVINVNNRHSPQIIKSPTEGSSQPAVLKRESDPVGQLVNSQQ